MVNDHKVQEGKLREKAANSGNLQQGSFSRVKKLDGKGQVKEILILKMIKVMDIEDRLKDFGAEKTR